MVSSWLEDRRRLRETAEQNIKLTLVGSFIEINILAEIRVKF